MLDLLYKRRSIRKFTDEILSDEITEKLKQSLLLSPTSQNKKASRFIFVSDPELIRKTASAKAHGMKAVETAPLLIAVVGLSDITDVWVEDCSIASIVVQLEAESLGLGSCWLQMRKRKTDDGGSSEEYMHKLLKLKENEKIESLIAVGYPAEQLRAHTKDELDFSRIENIS
ncbi:MAG: nitroreductase family protein [Spirochaetales bacterium]|uniref:Nitroreductase family protein n=1 Tax=Candidatus Thalassospirochaeta sargassi TaxID=3119039 RepID=A0AAJ1IDI1_9SPIO|nr:nitroreductase family protein [Spirochaetales bacterium]